MRSLEDEGDAAAAAAAEAETANELAEFTNEPEARVAEEPREGSQQQETPSRWVLKGRTPCITAHQSWIELSKGLFHLQVGGCCPLLQRSRLLFEQIKA